jgi:hypothetical protein
MKFASLFLFIILIFSCQKKTTDREQILSLLDQFLQHVDSKEMHNRFWANDLVYTSSSGKRFGKPEIMSGFSANDSISTDKSTNPIYSAKDISLRIFDKTALLSFELVSTQKDTVMYFLNTGVFISESGEWQVINWQATKKAG